MGQYYDRGNTSTHLNGRENYGAIKERDVSFFSDVYI
jgi:hypothetical protein